MLCLLHVLFYISASLFWILKPIDFSKCFSLKLSEISVEFKSTKDRLYVCVKVGATLFALLKLKKKLANLRQNDFIWKRHLYFVQQECCVIMWQLLREILRPESSWTSAWSSKGRINSELLLPHQDPRGGWSWKVCCERVKNQLRDRDVH